MPATNVTFSGGIVGVAFACLAPLGERNLLTCGNVGMLDSWLVVFEFVEDSMCLDKVEGVIVCPLCEVVLKLFLELADPLLVSLIDDDRCQVSLGYLGLDDIHLCSRDHWVF